MESFEYIIECLSDFDKIIHFKELTIEGGEILPSDESYIWNFMNSAESLILENCSVDNDSMWG